MSMFTISKDKIFEFFRYFLLGLVCFSFYYVYRVYTTTFILVPKLEQQVVRDSLKIESLTDALHSSHNNLSYRIDTVFSILKDEILPDLTFNSRKVDSLDTYTQVLNIRTAPLLHYRE